MSYSNQFKLLALFIFLSSNLFAQFPGCPNIDAGADVNLDCTVPCTPLTATPFEVGATDTYIVQSIPHTPPIAYDAPGGTGVSVNTDDVWSGVINLPFDFCFYGQTYNQCTIGSNGCIKFGTSLANAFHPWSYTATVPSAALTNAGDIFGPYHDIDPSVSGDIRWYLLGTAPCRIFVVSFDALAHFSCTSLTSTHMIVLYETTNAIDVYVENKAACPTWNSGNTVIGIQNPAGTVGLTPPGRNTGNWTVTTPEGWRFLPDGAPIYSVEWFEGATSIGTGNNIDVCPTETTTYTAQVTYTDCNGQIIIESDDVTVTKPLTDLDANLIDMTPAFCLDPSGSVEIAGTGGTPGYTYSSDNVTYTGSGIFSGLTAGDHTLFVQDINGCIQPVEVTVDQDPSDLEIEFIDVQEVTCAGSSDGEITVMHTGGTGPYTLTINGGGSTVDTLFTGLSDGNYTIEVTDDNGCTASIDTFLMVPQAFDIIDFVEVLDPTCFNGTDGEITVTFIAGTAPYSLTLNGGVPTIDTTFIGLGSGNYTVEVTDDNGCTSSLDTVLFNPTELDVFLVNLEDDACTSLIGEVAVDAVGGSAPYEFSITGQAGQVSGQFTGLGAGNYYAYVTDDNLCIDSVAFTINDIPAPTLNLVSMNPACNGLADGEVEVGAVGGSAPFQYQIDGGTFQASGNFTGLSEGSYLISVEDDNGCTADLNVDVDVIPLPQVMADAVGCNYGIQITGTSSPGGGIWSAADTAIHFTPDSAALNPFVYTTVPGVYIFTYTDDVCGNSDEVEITFPSYVYAYAPDTALCYGVEYVLTPSVHPSVNQWSWNTGSFEPSITVTEEGWYVVTVANECHVGYDSIYIDYKLCDIIPPNVLSFSSTAGNNVWYVQQEGLSQFNCVIVNRWGNVMYEFNDPSGYWDGTSNGERVSDGTYFYLIKAITEGGEEIEKHGFIQVVD